MASRACASIVAGARKEETYFTIRHLKPAMKPVQGEPIPLEERLKRQLGALNVEFDQQRLTVLLQDALDCAQARQLSEVYGDPEIERRYMRARELLKPEFTDPVRDLVVLEACWAESVDQYLISHGIVLHERFDLRRVPEYLSRD